MAISKVIYGGQTLIDLTKDTVTPERLLRNATAHGADGEVITGTCDFDANTQDATAMATEILSGKTAYNKGNKVEGTMPNLGKVTGELKNANTPYTIPRGYHDGSGSVSIDFDTHVNLVSDNIREGITILGVTGTMSGSEDVKAQALVITSSTEDQRLVPNYDEGYNYFGSVVVHAIPYVETDNSAGGKTVTIG